MMNNDPDYDDSADDWYADKMLDLAAEAKSGKRMKDYEKLFDFPHDDFDAPPSIDAWKWLHENNPLEYGLIWEEFFESPQPYDRLIEPKIVKILRYEWE